MADNENLNEEEAARHNRIVELFELFCKADSFKSIVTDFRELCDLLEINPCDHRSFLKRLRSRLQFWQAKHLWLRLERRSNQDVYARGNACANLKVFIIGAGPCGLRMAIECALMGAKVVVVEKRTSFSRHNVLHLWPFLIKDLQNLGSKKFYPKFCAGSIDHISIQRLQCMLLKVGLLMGIEVHAGVEFSSLVEPEPGRGWTARLSPSGHPLEQYEFDVIFGADGRTKSLPGFKRKEFRGKLAIAITANFVNYHTNAERQVPEISGVSQIFKQEFFKSIRTHTNIDLENLVYYQDDTHYFVMTAKKNSLLSMNVLKEDFNDAQQLLHPDNVDQEALLNYAKVAADFGTAYQLPRLDFALTQRGDPDVAMFDFTCRYGAENASRIIQRNGRYLLTMLIGDSLLEPFWPMGTGCARGFLAVFDAAWMMKRWASGAFDPLTIIAERESLYQLLSQTTPENTSRELAKYTIDPSTRYPNVNTSFFEPENMTHLLDTEEPTHANEIVKVKPLALSAYEQTIIASQVFRWCKQKLAKYSSICKITDLTTSWRNGVALACLMHLLDPDVIDPIFLLGKESQENAEKVLKVLRGQFDIFAGFTAEELATCTIQGPALIEVLLRLFEEFRKSAGAVTKERKQGTEYVDAPTSTGSENVARYRRRQKKRHRERNISDERRKKLELLIAGQSQDSDEGKWKREPGKLNPDLRSKISDAISGKAERDREIAGVATQDTTTSLDTDVIGKWELNDCSNALPLKKPLHQPEWDIEKGITEARRTELASMLDQRLDPPPPSKKPPDLRDTAGATKRMIDLLSYRKETEPPTGKSAEDRYQLSQQAKDNIQNIEGGGSDQRRSFQEFDDRIKASYKRLEKGNLGNLDVGVKGQNKVTQLSKRLITDYNPESSVFAKRAVIDRPIVTNQSFSDFCFFCRHRVHLPVERSTAEGYFFHKSCWKCAACDKMLTTDEYIFVRLEEKFYCIAHGQNLRSPRMLSADQANIQRASLRFSRESREDLENQLKSHASSPEEDEDESDLSYSSNDELSESGDNEYSSDEEAKPREPPSDHQPLSKRNSAPVTSPIKREVRRPTDFAERRQSSFADEITKKAISSARESFFGKAPEPVRLDPFAMFIGPKSPVADTLPPLSPHTTSAIAKVNTEPIITTDRDMTLPEPSQASDDQPSDSISSQVNQSNSGMADAIIDTEPIFEKPLEFGDVDDFIDEGSVASSKISPPVISEPPKPDLSSNHLVGDVSFDLEEKARLPAPDPGALIRLASAESVDDYDYDLDDPVPAIARNSSSNISAHLDISPDELPIDGAAAGNDATLVKDNGDNQSGQFEYRFRSDSDPGPQMKADFAQWLASKYQTAQIQRQNKIEHDHVESYQPDEELISQNGIDADDHPGITFEGNDIDFADDDDDISLSPTTPSQKVRPPPTNLTDHLRRTLEEKRLRRAQQAKEVTWMGKPPPVDDI